MRRSRSSRAGCASPTTATASSSRSSARSPRTRRPPRSRAAPRSPTRPGTGASRRSSSTWPTPLRDVPPNQPENPRLSMTTPNPARLRVALVGAGYVAGHHLAALKRLDFVDVVGICDPNQEAARALAARHGVERVATDLAGLAEAKPHAVHVLTPPATHAAIALQALEMGCSVLVEK